jgi:hypothetical protein
MKILKLPWIEVTARTEPSGEIPGLRLEPRSPAKGREVKNGETMSETESGRSQRFRVEGSRAT